MAKKKTPAPAKQSKKQPVKPEKMPEKVKNPVISFRGASETALNCLDEIKNSITEQTGTEPTQGEVFNEMAARARTFSPVLPEGTENVNKAEFQTLLGPYYKDDLTIIQNIAGMMESFKTSLADINAKVLEAKNTDSAILEAERETFKETLEDVNNQLEKIKRAAVFLSEDKPEFVCCLSPEVGEAARKARKFIYEDGRIKNPDKEQYPNELANLAIEFFLVTKYESVVLRK